MKWSAVPEPVIDYAPKSYPCLRAEGPLELDGRLDKPFWAHAPWTEDFVDIEGDLRPLPSKRTRVKMLWDDEYFYIGAELEEDEIWATLTERDSVIFYDNDFEIFIDPDGDTHQYYEFEINALNTVWDLLLVTPYRDGGPPVNGWDIQGLRTAVHIDGELNNPAADNRRWSVEVAMPWRALQECAPDKRPPLAGEYWRVNFSRVQWRVEVQDGQYRKQVNPATGRPYPEDNWVWSPQGVVNMHYPELWGYVVFSDSAMATASAAAGTSAMATKANGSQATELSEKATAEHSTKAEHPTKAEHQVGSSAAPGDPAVGDARAEGADKTTPVSGPLQADVFVLPPDERIKWLLRRLYYRQRNYYAEHGRFTDELALLARGERELEELAPRIEIGSGLFRISARSADSSAVYWIREDGKLWRE